MSAIQVKQIVGIKKPSHVKKYPVPVDGMFYFTYHTENISYLYFSWCWSTSYKLYTLNHTELFILMNVEGVIRDPNTMFLKITSNLYQLTLGWIV